MSTHDIWRYEFVVTSEDDKNGERPILIRFPEGSGLRKRLEESAKAGRRTLTAEVLARLEFTFANRVTVHDTGFDVEGPEYVDDPKPDARISLEQRIMSLEGRIAALEAATAAKG